MYSRVIKDFLVILPIAVVSMFVLAGDISFDKDGKEIFRWVGPFHHKG